MKLILNKYRDAKLHSNYFYMLANQLLINITPLIVLPIILPTIKETNYGNIVVTASVASFFLIILDYGMNLYGTKKIAESKNPKFNQILFINVTLLKIILALIGLFFFILINQLINNFQSLNFLVFYYLAIAFNGLLPLWYFQGIERFELVTIVNLISKGIFILLIILLIEQEVDWVNYSKALSIGNGLSLLGSLLIIQKNTPIKIQFLNSRILFFLFKKGFGYFNFNLVSTVYIASSTMIMSFIGFDKALIGEFGIAEKIVRGIRQIFNPISKVIYPFLARIKKSSQKNYTNSFNILIISVSLLAIFTITLLYIFSDLIVGLIGVNNIYSTKKLMLLLSPLILLGTLSNLYVTSGLILNNKIKRSNVLIVLASVVYLVIVMIPNQVIERFAYAILIAELVLIIGSLIILKNGESR